MPELVSGETIAIQRGRLLADAAAALILLRADADRGKVSDDDILYVARQWVFRKNEVRQNVIPEGQTWVFSDTLGLLRDRCGRYIMSGASQAYPHVMLLLNRWMKDCWGEHSQRAFCCTSISFNKGYAAKLHRDGNNHGPSICKAIGEFSGGRLAYYAEDEKNMELPKLKADQQAVFLDVKSAFQVFDGNRAHYVEAFTGERFRTLLFLIRSTDLG